LKPWKLIGKRIKLEWIGNARDADPVTLEGEVTGVRLDMRPCTDALAVTLFMDSFVVSLSEWRFVE
jgi:hypothetical protein